MLRTFRDLSRFTVGTIGEPGDRTFFLQIRAGNALISTSIEKSQVGAISERLRYMLKEIRIAHPLLPKPSLTRDSLPLENPVLDEFRVGSIAIFFDEESRLIQIDLRELNLNSQDEDDEDLEVPILDGVEVLRIFITPTQANIFQDRAELVIAAGRQPCPFCALPIDPQGHLCARANGYRR
jgi:uncharacterized repeat protein (TIGR03847 family)